MRGLAIATLLAAFALLAGCERRDDLDGARRPPPGLNEAAGAYALPTGGKPAVYDLIANRLAIATYRDGHLLVDAGAAHLAAYRDRGDDWIPGVKVDGERAALIGGRGGSLWLPLGDGIERGQAGDVSISIRARPAVADQLASVYLNERRLGDIRMPEASWGRYRITAPASAIRRGENKLRFYFRSTGELAGHATAAAIGRIAAGSPQGAPPDGERFAVAIETRGGDRLPAIAVPERTRLSHAAWIPEGDPELVFAVAGAGASASVRATRPGGEPEELWSGRAAADWTPVRVKLDDYAGDVARLELFADGAASFGAPQVVAHRGGDAPAAEAAADFVLIWIVSGLRADRAFDPEIAPAMAAFAEGATVAARAHSEAPSAQAAHAVIVQGDVAAAERGLEGGAATLGERFARAGFTTAVASGEPAITADAGFSRGADRFFSPRSGADATEVWEQARAALEDHRGGQALLYVATAEPEFPYEPSDASLAATWPEPPVVFGRDLESLAAAIRRGSVTPNERERRYIEALYDASVRDADRAFGAMLADLDALGVADRTAVILAGAYGQALLERGEVGTRPWLYDEMVRVPLAARLPGRSPGAASEVSLVDIHATALGAAGIPLEPGLGSRDVAGTAARPIPRPISLTASGRARGLAVGRYKLLVASSGEHELYDRARDPREREDLAGAAPAAERYMRGLFGLATSYGDAWDPRRWGELNDPRPAFADDVGG